MHLSCARAGKCGGLLGVGVHVKANQFHRNRIYSFTWPQKEETACTARALSLVSTRCVSFGLAGALGRNVHTAIQRTLEYPGWRCVRTCRSFGPHPCPRRRRTPHRSTGVVPKSVRLQNTALIDARHTKHGVVPKSVRLTLTHVARPYDVHMLGTTESVLFISTRFKWIRQPEPRGCVHDVCMFAMKHNTRRNEAQHTDVVRVQHIHQRHPASSLAPGTWCHRFSIQAGNKHT